jgi:hypothetical protein
MKYKIIPNRTIPEKKVSVNNKKKLSKSNESETLDSKIRKDHGTVPTRFQYDDDFDNWFPWES